MPELVLSTSSPFLLLLGIMFAIPLAVLGYRFTIPPISSRLRAVLISLRAAGLSFLFFLISEPVLSLLYHTTKEPAVAIVLDNSRSMTIADHGVPRSQQLRSVLEGNAFRRFVATVKAKYVLFGNNARILDTFSTDSLTFAAEATDIAAALVAVRDDADRSNIRAVLLISDGNPTIPTSPLREAEELGLPLFTIGIGDTLDPRDVLIRRVLTNSIAYAGTRVPVNATLKSSGYGGQRVEVTLRDGSRTLDRQIVTLQSGAVEYSVPLAFTPEREGVQKVTVEVSGLPDELTESNNKTSVFLRVLKSKMKVLLIAGGPSPDVAFVRRVLEQDPSTEVRTFIERKDGQFYEGPFTSKSLQDVEVILMVGFPAAGSTDESVNLIGQAAAKGTGLFFLPGRLIETKKLSPLEPFLPVLIQNWSPDEFQAFLSVPERQKVNVLFKTPGVAFPGDDWSKLPPLFQVHAATRAKPESEVLGVSRMQGTTTNEPLLVSRTLNRQKSLAFLGYGLWRWGLSSEETHGLPERFTTNAVRWLATREDSRRVRVGPTAETFSSGDPVEFDGQVYDEAYRAVPDARVTVKINGGPEQHEVTLSPIGNGQYEARVDGLPEGDYRYVAAAVIDGKPLGEDRGTFSVGGLNVEFQETRMNKLLMQQLAARTGGRFYLPGSMNRLADDMTALSTLQPRTITRLVEIQLWNREWLLAAVLTFFSIEWILRKRRGML